MRGFIETVAHRQIRGWAFDPSAPDLHVEICVYCGDQRLALTLANIYRQDLEDAGLGSGDHAFVVNLANSLADTDLPKIRVLAICEGELTDLARADRYLDPNAYPGLPRLRGSFAGEVFPDHRPIFILGAARSGTSAIAQALLNLSSFEGAEEGHFFAIVGSLSATVEQFFVDVGEETMRRTLVSRVPQEVVISGLRDLILRIASEAYPTGRWIDKSPNARTILAAPAILDIFPKAKFVFMKRRAIENVNSRLKKFPGLPFEAHCRDWNDVMQAWLNTRDRLGGNFIEIDQMDIATSPSTCVDLIRGFIDLDADEAQRLLQMVKSERPEQTSDSFGAATSLYNVPWSDEEKAVLMKFCFSTMCKFNYTLDETYSEIGSVIGVLPNY